MAVASNECKMSDKKKAKLTENEFNEPKFPDVDFSKDELKLLNLIAEIIIEHVMKDDNESIQ